LMFSSVVDLVIFIAGFWAPIILVPLVFGLYDITISKAGMVTCAFVGSLSFIIWECSAKSDSDLKGVFIGTLVSLLAFIVFRIGQRR